MINPGTYRARAMGSTAPHVQFGRAGTGTEQVAVRFMLMQEVYDGDNPTGEYEPTGEEIPWIGSFTPKTEERTIESLMHAGWDGVDIGDLSGLGSKDVDLVIDHEEYEGKQRARVQWVNKPSGGAFKFKEELAGAGFTELRKRMKAVALKVRGANGQQQRPAATAQRPQDSTRRPSAGWGKAPPSEWDGTGADPSGGTDDIPF